MNEHNRSIRRASGLTGAIPNMVSARSIRHATFRFYAELNDLLPPARRFVAFTHEFELPASVKDMIESMGVPHTEVNLILLNGTPVDFSRVVQDRDRISVYPAFNSPDVRPPHQLRPPLHEPRFVVDTHLGRLATYLRLLGFDALYNTKRDDRDLSQISAHENRILLTRDCGLLKRGEVVHGCLVRTTEPKQQVIEVLRRFDLFSAVAPFRRCLRCNTVLNPVSKESILERLPPRTRENYEEFRTCPSCSRIYWGGSHYAHMQRLVQHVLAG